MINIFCEAIRRRENVTYDYDDFLILESINPKKASYHLLLKSFEPDVPTLFPNNKECGRFVDTVITDVIQALKRNSILYDKFDMDTLQSLFKITEHGDEKKIIIDKTIYTKNRQFRMLGSCKFGRNDTFQLSVLNKFKHTPDNFKDTIEISLVGNYHVTREKKQFKMFSFVQSIPNVAMNSPVSPDIAEDPQLPKSTHRAPISSDACIESPYKRFFGAMAEPGKIRNVVPIGNDRFLINFNQNYKYCANIGRHHVNNNIYIIFDQRNKTYEQKCHDERCKHFSTGQLPITSLSSAIVYESSTTANVVNDVIKGQRIIAQIQVR